MSEAKAMLLVSAGLTAMFLAVVGAAIWWKARQATPAKPVPVADPDDLDNAA